MSPTEAKLKKIEAFAKRMVAENGKDARLWATTDRREAIRDADFVVVTINPGGLAAYRHDYEIPMKYGVDQCIGDTLGPGGVFRGARTIPVLAGIADDMRSLAKPTAIMLQYANPMATNCVALGMLDRVPFVGLCHGVQTTLDLIARYCDVPKQEIDFTAGGINHMDWFLTLTHKGKDLYPRLREVFERPEYYKNEKVRGEMFRQFGYFMTESTGHLSEYLPYFRKNRKALDTYCDEPMFGGESGAYYKFANALAEKYREKDPIEFDSTKLTVRSVEYCTYIMEAAVTGTPFRFMGNVRNDGFIDDLPSRCAVEVPVIADSTGLHPVKIGALPTQCAALCRTNINVQLLAAEAALAGNTEALVHAVSLDPLSAAVLTLAEIRSMTAEMFDAERAWLPQFEGKKIRSTPAVSIPKGITAVDVPLDPALAVVHRFGTLAERNI